VVTRAAEAARLTSRCSAPADASGMAGRGRIAWSRAFLGAWAHRCQPLNADP
jgi:hypothetical protein